MRLTLQLLAIACLLVSQLMAWFTDHRYPDATMTALLFWLSWNIFLSLRGVTYKEIKNCMPRGWNWVEGILGGIFMILVIRRFILPNNKILIPIASWDGMTVILIFAVIILSHWIFMRRFESAKLNSSLAQHSHP
jgi:hypothetical protein